MIKELGFKFYKPLIWYKPDTMGVFPRQYGCNYEVVLWFRNETKKNGKVKLNMGCGQRDVFQANSTGIKGRKEAGFHPTPKPLNIIRKLVENGSDVGDLILDCFMGSGTTAVVCKQSNRNFIGFELDQKWIDVSNKRLSQDSLMEKDWFGVKNAEK